MADSDFRDLLTIFFSAAKFFLSQQVTNWSVVSQRLFLTYSSSSELLKLEFHMCLCEEGHHAKTHVILVKC